MKWTLKHIGLLLLVALFFTCTDRLDTNTSKMNLISEAQIDKLIDKMTLRQKIGQMTQINIDVISKGEIYNLQKPHTLDSSKLDSAFSYYCVGSVLNAGGHTYTRKHWHDIIKIIQNKALNTGAKIPVIYGIDAIHGANYTVGATLFPQQIGIAATWDREIAFNTAAITAYDVAASGIKWNFSPVLDLGRQTLWGRFFETFGEDVYLAQEMGKAYVNGYQGSNPDSNVKVAACLKHFVGYSFPLSGKDRTPAWIPERMLRTYFLPIFESAIKQGALSIMVNSGELNGVPLHADDYLLKNVLRDELGFEGILLTDWEDIIKLYKDHHVAGNMKEAVKLAIDAGIDMSMTPNDFSFNIALEELVLEGSISHERINQSVKRILNVKSQLGLFRTPVSNYEDYTDFGSEKHSKVSLDAANASITMVKNNNILPISAKKKILVTGPGANSLNYLNGAWTHTWQGDDTSFNTFGKHTILQALQSISKHISYVQGASLNQEINIKVALEKAKKSEVVIICLAEDPATEGPADINTLEFPDVQLQLVKEIANTGKKIILVTTTSRPRIMREIVDLVDAILIAYLPGDEGGTAIAQTIFGLNNPSGKLPFTYPKYQGLNVVYDHKHTEKKGRFLGQITSIDQSAGNDENLVYQWPFGFGLSYSNFEYSNLMIKKDSLKLNDTLDVQVSLKNNSSIPGKEVVQLYITDCYASITPSVKKLKAFTKIYLSAGETKSVNFKVPVSALAFVNRKNQWQTESGDFILCIDSLTKGFYVK